MIYNLHNTVIFQSSCPLCLINTTVFDPGVVGIPLTWILIAHECHRTYEMSCPQLHAIVHQSPPWAHIWSDSVIATHKLLPRPLWVFWPSSKRASVSISGRIARYRPHQVGRNADSYRRSPWQTRWRWYGHWLQKWLYSHASWLSLAHLVLAERAFTCRDK